MANQDDARNVIQDLIETLRDGQNGYREAAEHIKDSEIRSFFQEQSLERARFAGELEAELIRLGKPDKKISGSVGGALRPTCPVRCAAAGSEVPPSRAVERRRAYLSISPARSPRPGSRGDLAEPEADRVA